jgi:hypothetical protein
MKKAITLALSAGALFCVVGTAPAQEKYKYSVSRTRGIMIDWRPEENLRQRYTVSVSPLRLISHGLKFDFEYELPRPGHWLGTSLQVYLAPQRRPQSGYYWDRDGNNRASFNSGWDEYHRMWGIGSSMMFKNHFSPRGWYFSTGITFDYFRVGRMEADYIPYVEDNLTFYAHGNKLVTKSYFKPTAQINIGKHMALSERCFFDLHAGLGYSHSFYKFDDRHMDGNNRWWHTRFSSLGGFAYRGFVATGGFRFGVLLWARTSAANFSRAE